MEHSMSTLALANIKGVVSTGNVITIPTGHKLISTDTGGIYIPGSITQTYQAVKTDTFSATPNGTWTSVTGLSISIVPRKTSSQILIFMNLIIGGNGTTAKARLLRNGVAIALGNTGNSGQQLSTFGSFLSYDGNQAFPGSAIFLDSPATTGSQTYQLQINNDNATVLYVNRGATDAASATGGRFISSITVMEVAV